MTGGAMNVLAGLSEFSIDSFHQLGKSFREHSEEQRVSILMLLLSQSGSNHEFGWFVDDLRKMLRDGEVEPLAAAYAVLVMDAFGRSIDLPHALSHRYFHEKAVQSAQRILALRKYAFPEENRAQGSSELSPHEYDTDLTWFHELEDDFLLPLAHSRLQISAIAQAMDGLQIHPKFFVALESFSSTGHQHGFILAQLFISQGNIERGKELIGSLLEVFVEFLPEPVPTEQLIHDVEKVIRSGKYNPRQFPWAESRSELYWRLILNGL